MLIWWNETKDELSTASFIIALWLAAPFQNDVHLSGLLG